MLCVSQWLTMAANNPPRKVDWALLFQTCRAKFESAPMRMRGIQTFRGEPTSVIS